MGTQLMLAGLEQDGLRARRNAEAQLFEQGLASTAAA
jgi:GH24 family phage-related lysozyme (muramidase)